MYKNYCFKCGAHVLIDETTKLCGPCYSTWMKTRRAAPRTGP